MTTITSNSSYTVALKYHPIDSKRSMATSEVSPTIASKHVQPVKCQKINCQMVKGKTRSLQYLTSEGQTFKKVRRSEIKWLVRDQAVKGQPVRDQIVKGQSLERSDDHISKVRRSRVRRS